MWIINNNKNNNNNNIFLTRRLYQQGDFQRGPENRKYKKIKRSVKWWKATEKFPTLKT